MVLHHVRDQRLVVGLAVTGPGPEGEQSGLRTVRLFLSFGLGASAGQCGPRREPLSARGSSFPCGLLGGGAH